MKLTKKNFSHFIENIETLKPVEGPAYLEFEVKNTFFAGRKKRAKITLKYEDGQWWYSVGNPPEITGNPEKISPEEVAEIIAKYLPAVNDALAEMPWALCEFSNLGKS